MVFLERVRFGKIYEEKRKGIKRLFFTGRREMCVYIFLRSFDALIHSRHWMLNLIWKLLEITTHLRNIGSIGI